MVPIAAGATVLTWAVASHYRAAPHGWGPTPDYLLATGPYRYSRNPMYLAEAAIWAGWTVLYGSAPVAGGLVVLVAVQSAAVPLEERVLHRRWGDPYDEYRARVPRYL